jgi:Universal stress protein family
MFTHILIPLDGSEYAERAIEPARSLAEKYGARITLLTVMWQFPQSPLQGPIPDQRSEERGRRYLEDVRATQMGAASAPVDLVVKHGMPAESIAEVALDSHADLIVHEYAWHDRDAVHPGKHRLENPSGRTLSSAAHCRSSPHDEGITSHPTRSAIRVITLCSSRSRERLILGGHAAMCWGEARNSRYHSRNVASQSSFKTRVRICRRRCTPLVGTLLPKLPAPLADRFVRHEYTTREHRFLDVAVAEAEPGIQPDTIVIRNNFILLRDTLDIMRR